jgi:tetratricopeptide (TPR) repeat protein
MRHRDRLPPEERYRVEMVQYQIANEMDSLIASARSMLDLDSTDVQALHNLGLAYGRQQDFARAETYFARALAADSAHGKPSGFTRFFALARVQYMLGKAADARRTLERGHAAVRGPAPFFHPLARLDVATGRYDDADRRVREALAQAPPGPQRHAAEEVLMALDFLRGRMSDGLRRLDGLGEEAAERGRHAAALATGIYAATRSFEALGDTAAARRRLAESLRRHPLDSLRPADRPYLPLARLQALLGDPAAPATLAAFERAAKSAVGQRGNVQGDELARSQAVVARAQGDYPRAAALLREAEGGNCLACGLHLLAETHERAGAADSARAAYERYFTLPHYERMHDGPHVALSHERLARLLEARGDRVGAEAHYAEFVELWKGADAALQPRVRAAREALARLRGAG